MKRLKKRLQGAKRVLFQHFDTLFLFFLLLALTMLAGGKIAQMDIFERKIRPLEDFQENANARVLAQVEAKEADVVRLNAEEQLYAAGVRSDGSDIEPPYTPFTVRLKGFRGQPTDRVTLRDTGDFHRSFRLEFNADEFEIVAGDIKEQRLKAKYGDLILGLTEANTQKLIELIREPLIEKLKSELA
jgi:hypothetical protein